MSITPRLRFSTIHFFGSTGTRHLGWDRKHSIQIEIIHQLLKLSIERMAGCTDTWYYDNPFPFHNKAQPFSWNVEKRIVNAAQNFKKKKNPLRKYLLDCIKQLLLMSLMPGIKTCNIKSRQKLQIHDRWGGGREGVTWYSLIPIRRIWLF